MVAAAFGGAFACAAPATMAQAPVPTAAPVPVTAAGGSIVAGPGALLNRLARLEGTLAELTPGAPVQIQRLVPGRGWVPEATTTAGAGGSFSAEWRPRQLGRFEVRAVPAGDAARAAAAPPTASVMVYRPARATWYGPGFYGRRTACGQVLSHRLMGVAHKRLPCGTPIEMHFGGRTITVPVVDRGPFANGASYDLTSAAAEQLGLTTTTTLGVAPQRGRTMSAPLAPPPPLAGTGGVAPPPALVAP
jgi:rare lipoprotein A